MATGLGPLPAALAGILAGALCGLLIGLLITRLNVVPFIITLGMMLIVRGLAKGLANEQKIDAPVTWLNELLAALWRRERAKAARTAGRVKYEVAPDADAEAEANLEPAGSSGSASSGLADLERALKFVQKLARKHAAQNVLLVVHAGVIHGLICHFLGLPYAPNLKRHISHRYVGLFEFADGLCWRYDEQGDPSSFVTDGVVSIPWKPESNRANTN